MARSIDPAAGTVGTNVRFPLAPGTHIVRYFIGLRNNQPAERQPGLPRIPTSTNFRVSITNLTRSFCTARSSMFRTTRSSTRPTRPPTETPPQTPVVLMIRTFSTTRTTAHLVAVPMRRTGQRSRSRSLSNQNLDLMVIRRTDIRAINDPKPVLYHGQLRTNNGGCGHRDTRFPFQ